MTAGDLVSLSSRPSLGIGVVTDCFKGDPAVVRVEWPSVAAPNGRRLWGYYREDELTTVALPPVGGKARA